jgi:hypothetical protein
MMLLTCQYLYRIMPATRHKIDRIFCAIGTSITSTCKFLQHFHTNYGTCCHVYTGHTQLNGAVLIATTIKTAPLFCVCPVYASNYVAHTPISIQLSVTNALA